MKIKKLTKFQTRNPAKKPKKPAPRVLNILGNETLNWLVINVYDMPCKIKKDAIAIAIIVRALLYGVSPTAGIFTIIGRRKTAR
jgi:hypothetical protein